MQRAMMTELHPGLPEADLQRFYGMTRQEGKEFFDELDSIPSHIQWTLLESLLRQMGRTMAGNVKDEIRSRASRCKHDMSVEIRALQARVGVVRGAPQGFVPTRF